MRTVLTTMPAAELASYILMQRIWPASQSAMLVRNGACRTGPAVSEPARPPHSRRAFFGQPLDDFCGTARPLVLRDRREAAWC